MLLQIIQFDFASFLCPCVILPKSNSEALQKVEKLNRKYQVGTIMVLITRADSSDTYPPLFLQRVLHDLVESSRYDTREDFTVVIQPFFREIVIPRLPVSD